MSRRIGFVRMGPHPIPNRLLPPELEKRFPGYRLDVLDVEQAIRRDRLAMLVNGLFVALEQGPALLRGAVRPWQAFFTTTWMFRRMSRLARHWVEAGDFAFTVQIQSLFDASAPGIPHFVYTDHTHLANLDYPDFDRRTLRGARWLALERALYHRAAAVFTRSRNVTQSLLDHYGCTAARAICVGAGTNASVAARPAVPEAGVHILFVGVDWDRKGGPELIEAFLRLLEHHPDARLTIVGCTPDVEHPAVRIVGRVPLEEIHRYYAEATIFCMPTRREPFGVAFVEALHHGLPIVATRVGALPDLVHPGENGELVAVGDVADLAAKLTALAADPALRRSMGQASREHARSNYTWDNVTGRMANVIADALESRSERRA